MAADELTKILFTPDAWMESEHRRKFHYFDPYSTYTNSDNDRFVSPDGTSLKELTPDTEALFNLGEKVFARLPRAGSKEEFDSAYACYWTFLDELRETFCKMLTSGQLRPQNEKGQAITFDPAMLDDMQVVSLCWQLDSDLGLLKKSCEDSRAVFCEMNLFHALREIDNALIGIALDGRESVVAAIEATNALANAIALSAGNAQLVEARKQFAYDAAMARIQRDPKQKEKAFVRECWERWMLSGESCYKSKAAFARDMLEKCELLESQKKIEDWCREWEKNGTQPAQ